MTLLTWNHAYPVGVRALDDQHGILMDAMNDLRLALVRGSGRAEVCELLNRLLKLTQMHFTSEERLLEQYGFPGLEDQRAEHQHLLGDLRESAQRAQHSEEVGMRDLLGLLRNGFAEHIQAHDSQYGPWLNDRGVY